MAHTDLDVNLPITQKDKPTPYFEDYLYTNIHNFSNTSNTELGDALIGVKLDSPNAVARTQHDKNAENITVLDLIPASYHASIADGTITDDLSVYLQYAATNHGLNFTEGTFPIANTVFVPVFRDIRGVGIKTVIKPILGGTFTNGFIFSLNSTNVSSWDTGFPNIHSGTVEGMYVTNQSSGLPIIRGFFGAGSYKFEDLKFDSMTQSIKTTASNYSDSITINRIHSLRCQLDEYQVYAGFLGDGLTINNVHCTVDIEGTRPKSVRVDTTLGGSISNCIAGDYLVDRCHNINLNNIHTEDGQIEIRDSCANIDGLYTELNDIVPVIFTAFQSRHYSCSIKNAESVFPLRENPVGYIDAEIQIHSNYHLHIENCYRRLFSKQAVSVSEISGIKVLKQDGSPFDEFNKKSYMLSRKSEIFKNQALHIDQSINTGSGLIYISTINTSALAPFQGATDTYYYNLSILYDSDRLIGRVNSNPEQSIALTFDGNVPILLIDYNQRTANCIVRLYRGTATNSYDMYVDIPAIALGYIYDEGDFVNGFPWVARSAGAVDTLRDFEQLEFKGDAFVMHGVRGLTPSVGTFAAGNQYLYVNPFASGHVGEVCVVSGTPGTWAAFGPINLSGTISWNPASLLDGEGETSLDITVTGAVFGDYVIVGAPYDMQGFLISGYVSAADTVKIRIQNETGGTVNLGLGTWKVRVER